MKQIQVAKNEGHKSKALFFLLIQEHSLVGTMDVGMMAGGIWNRDTDSSSSGPGDGSRGKDMVLNRLEWAWWGEKGFPSGIFSPLPQPVNYTHFAEESKEREFESEDTQGSTMFVKLNLVFFCGSSVWESEQGNSDDPTDPQTTAFPIPGLVLALFFPKYSRPQMSQFSLCLGNT